MFDETGFSGSLSSSDNFVVVQKSVSQAFNVQLSLYSHVTINFAVLASGQTLPPLIFFKESGLGHYILRVYFITGYLRVETTDFGFINTDLLYKWFEQIFFNPLAKGARVCLSCIIICPMFQVVL